jgi:kynurenine 3-monooxygenase
MSSKNVTIIGGGLVGCLWAVLLRQRGYEVSVYEKRSDMRKSSSAGDRSINLVITSRGLHGLKVAGLLKKATALSVSVFGRMIHASDTSCFYQAYGQENEYNLSISRSALNLFLLNAAEEAGAKFHFEHELENIDFQNKTMDFVNGGKSVAYDLLFGTDGAGSLVRKNLIRTFPDQYSDKIDWLGADYIEMFMPKTKEGRPQIKQSALHIWPRGSHMMMALANLDGSFTVTLYMPKSGPVSFESVHDEASVKKLFAEEFADAVALMPDFAPEFLNHPRGKLGTVRCNKWSYGDSVALMGDAAHAMVPFFGQGMNCGFEDCTDMLELMEKVGTSNWTKLLATYDEVRRPQGNAIADMAVENWHEMADKVADVGFLMRKKVETRLEKEFPRLFKSRYGLVAYTRVPYRTAQLAGLEQEKILSKLCEGLHSPQDLSLERAEALLRSDYVPFLKEQGLLN